MGESALPGEEELVGQQERLQGEARALVDELELMAFLGTIGEPTVVGSAALGVMVRRDFDVTVACPALDHDTRVAVARLGADLAVA